MNPSKTFSVSSSSAFPRFVSVVVFLVSPVVAESKVEPLGYVGSQVPGSRPGNVFTSESAASGYSEDSIVMDDTGRAYFVASTTDEGEAIWVESEPGGDLEFLVKVGDPAPETEAGTTFSHLASPNRSPLSLVSGGLVFSVFLAGDSVDASNDLAVYLWSEATGSIRLLFRDGDPVPGSTSDFIEVDYRFTRRQVRSSGRFVFLAKVYGPDVTVANDWGLFAGISDSPTQLVIREGDSAPGTSSGEMIGTLNDFEMNITGSVAYEADLVGTGTDASNSRGIFVGPLTSAGQTLAIRAGDPAPGIEADSVFDTSLSLSDLDDDGNISFRSTVSGPNIVEPDASASWTKAPGQSPQMSIVPASTLEGDPAPGTPAGVTFDNFVTSSSIGSNRFLIATLTGPGVDAANDWGVWAGTPGNLRLVGREGGRFATGFNVSIFDTNVNNAGQYVFIGDVPGEVSFWLVESDGSLKELLRVGDAVIVDGVSKTISSMGMRLSSSTAISAFSATGRAALRLTFTDSSSGAFAVTGEPDPPGSAGGACVNAALKASLNNAIKKLKKKIKKVNRSGNKAKAKKLKKKLKTLKKKLASLPC